MEGAVRRGGRYLEPPPRCAEVRIWHYQGVKLESARCYLEALQVCEGANRRGGAGGAAATDLAVCKHRARRACVLGWVDLERQCDECALAKWAMLVEYDGRLRAL
jgi:hypothetical protein